jgi:hypothetical protein
MLVSIHERHYGLEMLLNVRLGPEEIRAVKGLRRAKVNVSALVRRAIRDAAPKGGRRASLGDAIDEILHAHPTVSRSKPDRPPLDDRRAMSRYIRAQLRRGRR